MPSVYSVLILCALLLVVVSGHEVKPNDSTTAYYGYLKIPMAYLEHPDSQSSLNYVQPPVVILSSSEQLFRVPVQRDGSFVGYNIPYGTYLLQAEYHDFQFPTVRVDIQYKEDGNGGRTPLIRSYANDYPVKPLEGTGLSEESPAVIPVLGLHAYYTPREQYRITDLLKNPMILMMLVSIGLMGMLKLFPEEELKESQKLSKEWQKKVGNIAAGALGDNTKDKKSVKSKAA